MGALRTPARSLAQTLLLAVAAVLMVLLLPGCAYVGPHVDVGDTKPAAPAPVPAAPAQASGSIFSAGAYRPLFEDHRARLVGDTLTVNIVEKVTATAKSTSTVEKSGAMSGGITALPGIAPNALRRATADASTAASSEGSGSTENSNDFSGTITVIVRQVLPNGHLLVAGEKQIGVNQNIDVLRFSGQVDPRAIQPGNSVPSAAIANVRLEQRGRGAAAEAQAMGWLQRIFINVLPI
jgi:flagellar L-ring protein precursor FlgH